MGSTPAPGVAGRALAPSTRRVRSAIGLGHFRCARKFPQGRGKWHPGRARSPDLGNLSAQIRICAL